MSVLVAVLISAALSPVAAVAATFVIVFTRRREASRARLPQPRHEAPQYLPIRVRGADDETVRRALKR